MAAVVKALFIPISITGGLLAGMIGKKIFQQVWGVLDDEEPPDSEHRDIDYRKLTMALALEGAIFRVLKATPITACAAASPSSPASGPARRSPSPSSEGLVCTETAPCLVVQLENSRSMEERIYGCHRSNVPRRPVRRAARRR